MVDQSSTHLRNRNQEPVSCEACVAPRVLKDDHQWTPRRISLNATRMKSRLLNCHVVRRPDNEAIRQISRIRSFKPFPVPSWQYVRPRPQATPKPESSIFKHPMSSMSHFQPTQTLHARPSSRWWSQPLTLPALPQTRASHLRMLQPTSLCPPSLPIEAASDGRWTITGQTVGRGAGGVQG